MSPAFSSTKSVPGSICSGIHSLRTLSSITIWLLPSQFELVQAQKSPAESRAEKLFERGEAEAASCSCRPPAGLPTRNRRAHWFAGAHAGANFAQLVAKTNGEQRLARILQDINQLAGRGLHVNAAAIGQQMHFGTGAHSFH